MIPAPASAAPAICVIVGPTAAGKSALALAVAQARGGALISADAMQVYRGFDLGTAKPSAAEQAAVPHYGIDLLAPDEVFSAARFVAYADAVIAEVAGRGTLPIVVGGTGLYVRALLRGLFPTPPNDETIRARHQARRAAEGTAALYAELVCVDPEAAAAIDANDFVRISRALEVYELTGEKISALRAQHQFATVRYPAQVIGLDPGAALRGRIDGRIEAMIAAGWVDEVRSLIDRGYGDSHAMGALGYRQLAEYLRGDLDLAEAIRQTKRDTWHFARRQRNWFRSEPSVRWVQPGSLDVEQIGIDRG